MDDKATDTNVHHVQVSMLLLAAIQAYGRRARSEQQLAGVFERHDFLVHGGSVSRARRFYGENPSPTADTTESLSANVLKARKHIHEKPLPSRSAQHSGRSPPQTRLCTFDHLPNTRWYSRASSASATKRPPSPTMRPATRRNSSDRQATERSMEKPDPPEREQTWEIAEIQKRDQHTILMQVDNASDTSSHKVVWPRSNSLYRRHHGLEEPEMPTAEGLEAAKAATFDKTHCVPADKRWPNS